jgi:ABC-type branched-subunit amino acid transport system ATPase component
MKRSGVCIVLVEHEMDFIRRVCDHVVALANGRVVTSGDFETVAANPEVRSAYLGRQ